MKRPDSVRLTLCGLGLLSAFLPWLTLKGWHFSMTFTLTDLMSANSLTTASIYMQVFGGMLLIGSAALLIWKKAAWFQLSGMVLLTAPLVIALFKYFGEEELSIDLFMALLGTIGAGAVLAWAVSIMSFVLFGPARLRAWVERRAYIGKWISTLSPMDRPKNVRRVQTLQARSMPETLPDEHARAMASGERFLALGDLPAALRSFGRGLGASNDDRERAMSKVKIAVVLEQMGRDEEAASFLDEAEALDPEAVAKWGSMAEEVPAREQHARSRVFPE